MSLDLPHFSEPALCAETDEPEVFFPNKGGSTTAAKAICRQCPAVTECLEYALRHRVAGVWGGMSEPERGRLRSARGIKPKPVMPRAVLGCGTDAGAAFHRRRNESVCESCKAAARRAKQERGAA